MTRLIHRNQHSQHPKKYKKQPETRKRPLKRKMLESNPDPDVLYIQKSSHFHVCAGYKTTMLATV